MPVFMQVLCLYVNLHMHTHTHTHTHTLSHMHIRPHTCTHRDTCTCTRTRERRHTHTRTHTQTLTQSAVETTACKHEQLVAEARTRTPERATKPLRRLGMTSSISYIIRPFKPGSDALLAGCSTPCFRGCSPDGRIRGALRHKESPALSACLPPRCQKRPSILESLCACNQRADVPVPRQLVRDV